jgi:hypothetical protein
MSRRTRLLVHGLTDPRQALEASLLDIDGIVVRLGTGGPTCSTIELAEQIRAAVGPLLSAWAIVGSGARWPRGFSTAVTRWHEERPTPAAAHVAFVPSEVESLDAVPVDLDALWLLPDEQGTLPYRQDRVARFARDCRIVIQAPDHDSGLEALVRLIRPDAVILAEPIWYQPGIVDMDRLEAATRAVARANKAMA